MIFKKIYVIFRKYNKIESRIDVDWGFLVCFESIILCWNYKLYDIGYVLG